MSKPSLLSLRRIIYLNFFWLGFEYFRCQGDTHNGYLPPDEASALSSVADEFKSKVVVLPSSRSYCQQAVSNYGYAINCDDCKGGDNSTVCHIIEIMLSDLGLSGTIDEAIGDLQYLKKLVLSNNKLQGTIPTSLGNLRDIETLDLSNNQLTGMIPPSLGALENLQWLYLQNNFLEGSIPSSLGELENLLDLYLNYNKLSGSIPDELGSLLQLTRLNLAENKLSGTLPSSLGNMTKLITFWVPSNYLIGNLPDSYRALVNMKSFSVAGNNISGKLPEYVNEWQQIQVLSFVGNNFVGTIPRPFFNLSTLEYLLVSDLNTSPFKLPSESEANIPNIYSLVLRNCSIKGSIPEYISQASSLKYLDLSFNNLKGGIPESWKPNLIYMSFARNNLSGTIPTWIFQASRTRMDLSYNNFTDIPAPVPSDLNLNLFACCCCQNSSTIRPYMLQPLEMMKTYFPRGKPKFYSLFINSGGEQTTDNGILYDADNGTSGWHISSKQNWAYSSSGDFLTATVNSSDYTKRVPCEIPSSEASLYEEARLSPVSLHYYALNLRREKNYTVKLHFAEIVYSDNAEYNRLRKRIFDVYIQGENVLKDFNIRDQAEGPDRAIDRTFPKIRVENGLLDIHFYWTGKGSNHNPPVFNGPLISAISVTPEFKVGGGLTPWQKALISIASIIMAALLLLALAWGLGWLESAELQEEKDIGNNKKAKLGDIIKATNNFSTTNFIGSGSLGKVYLAKVGKDHQVAVKRLSSDFRERIHELRAEILHMTSLKDNNLLNVLDVHVGKRHQLLIYEYMQNKSLEDIFFGSSTFPKWELDWPTRYNICLGIGRGLKRLHKDKRSVVHGNIKMTNILLDVRKEPKLSDYGLAGVYTDENRILQIKKEAPKGFHPLEYFQGLVSDKTDVFSFGIVVLVIISGRRSEVDKGAHGTEYLQDTAHDYHRKDRLIELVDKNLNGKYDARQALSLLNIAVKCTSSTQSVRPTISDVLRDLDDDKTLTISDTITQPPTSTSKEVIDPSSEGHQFN